MRLTIKETCCPIDASLLVADNGTLTCEQGCELVPLGWHSNTQNLIVQALQYSRDQTTRKDDE